MKLRPQKTKYPKSHKGRSSEVYRNSQQLAFAQYGLISLESSRITASQINSSISSIKRKLKKVGVCYNRIFPHIPATAKPAEVRMGKGKGSIEFWYTRVRPGAILFEISSPSYNLAKLALSTAASKLPIKTAIIHSS